jgi:hypothetical protein
LTHDQGVNETGKKKGRIKGLRIKSKVIENRLSRSVTHKSKGNQWQEQEQENGEKKEGIWVHERILTKTSNEVNKD